MRWCKETLGVLSVGLVGACGAATPVAVTYTQHARAAAAKDFKCAEQDLHIADAEEEVFLIEGCGQVASFYCSETRTFDTRCSRVNDVETVAATGNLADALTAQDKADKEREAREQRSSGESSVAKQAP